MKNWYDENSEWVTIWIGSIVLSFLAGFGVKNWPYLVHDTTFRYSDIIGIGMGAIIAIAIPFFVKRFIENGSKNNDIVLKEINLYRDQLNNLNQKFRTAKISGVLENQDWKEIVYLTENLDAKFENVKQMVDRRCRSKSQTIIQDIENKHIDYWDAATHSNINQPVNVEISNIDFNREDEKYQELTTSILDLVLFISNY